LDFKNKPVLSQAKIHELFALEERSQSSLVIELAHIFETTAPQRVRRMNTAVAQKDWKQIKMEAHALKASSGNMGMERMHFICLELEKQVAGATVPDRDVELLLVELNRELFLALAELRIVVSGLQRKAA
jgi:HPt (histidine-containing phosphotransfer) domain-containing protein